MRKLETLVETVPRLTELVGDRLALKKGPGGLSSVTRMLSTDAWSVFFQREPVMGSVWLSLF